MVSAQDLVGGVSNRGFQLSLVVPQNAPFSASPFEFFFMSTLSKFVEVKPRGAEFCMQAGAVTGREREADFSGRQVPFGRGQSPSHRPTLLPRAPT